MVRSFESGRSAHDRVLVLLEGEERREFFQDFVFEQVRRAIDHYVYHRAADFLRRRHKVRARCIRRFSDAAIFGKFKVQAKPARTGRNPSTGATIEIAASKKVAFTPAKQLKDAVNG